MKDHRSTRELLEVVGPHRNAHAPEEVARAEAELKDRTSTEQTLFEEKARKIGNICAWLGGLFSVWGFAFVLIGFAFFAEEQPKTGQEPFMFRNFRLFFLGIAGLEAIAGLLLLVGGLNFRRRRNSGRKLILAVLWLTVAYVVLFTISWALSIPAELGRDRFQIAMTVLGVLMAAGWCALLWVPIRYFKSARVREFCQAAA